MSEFKVTLRKEGKGGSFRPEIMGYEEAFTPRRRLILLVHGFNVSEDQAEQKQYQPFEKRLHQHGVKWDIGEVYWPSDGRIPIVRNLQYPWLIKHAIECSSVFAKYLEKRRGFNNNPCEIVLIGHSLGCRLILETLRVLANQRGTNNTICVTAILMGAAVPVSLVKGNGYLRTGISIPIVKKAVVLYSRQDFVLSHLFLLGQAFTRDGLRDCEAVGLKGNPYNELWHQRIEMTNYQHGHYWEKEGATRQIASVLGVPVAKQLTDRSSLPSRQLPSREGPTSRFVLKSRNLRS